jgi:hypothetical protein
MKPAAIIELLVGLGSFILVIGLFLLPTQGGSTTLHIYDVDPIVLGVSCGLLISGVITDTVVLSLKPKPVLRVLAIVELTLGAAGLAWLFAGRGYIAFLVAVALAVTATVIAYLRQVSRAVAPPVA